MKNWYQMLEILPSSHLSIMLDAFSPKIMVAYSAYAYNNYIVLLIIISSLI